MLGSKIFAFCVLAAAAQGTTYYVSTLGNDGNDGLSGGNGAFATIAHAVKQPRAGDEIIVEDGEYVESKIDVAGIAGSNDNRLLIRSATKWGAKIVSMSPYHAVDFHATSTGVTFDGFEVTFHPDNTSISHGIQVTGNRITIRNCSIHHAPFSGIQGHDADNCIIEYCVIAYNCNGAEDSGENGSGISIAASMSREDNSGYHHIVRNNVIYGNEANNPVQGTGVPTDGNGIIFDYNNAGSYSYPHRSLCENNLVFSNGGRGIHVFLSRNVTIRNNTCYHNNYVLNRYDHYSGEIQVEGSGCEVFNNIAVQDPLLSERARAIKIYEVSALCSNNIFAGNLEPGPNDLSNNITLDKSDITSIRFANASIDPATADFTLGTGSIAIDAGTTESAPSRDILDVERPQGEGIDIGCYEWQATQTTGIRAPVGSAEGNESLQVDHYLFTIHGRKVMFGSLRAMLPCVYADGRIGIAISH